MRFLLSLMVLLFGATVARAQTASETYIVTGIPRELVGQANPLPVTNTTGTSAATQASGTITLGNAFQTALADSSTRKDCVLQNTASHVMYVYVGLLADATLVKSFQVNPGGVFYCGGDLSVVADAINITTSTTADPFVILNQ